MQQQKGSVIEHYMAEERHPICIQVVNKHDQTEYYKTEERDIASICIYHVLDKSIAGSEMKAYLWFLHILYTISKETVQ